MKLHELKIKEEYYREIEAGNKTFEIRKNDRDFQAGDYINFTIVRGSLVFETYPLFKITYVLKNVPEYGLDKDYCIFGFKILEVCDKEYEEKIIRGGRYESK